MRTGVLSTYNTPARSIRTRATRLWLVALTLIRAATVAQTSAASARQPVAHATSYAQQCAEPYPAQRDESNPLDLPTPPGADPLTGANFFIPGPAHGSAAGGIAQLLGVNTKTLPDSESWASFARDLSFGPLAAKLGCQAGRQPRARSPGRGALKDRQPARGAALQRLLRGRWTGRDLRSGREDLLPQHDRRPWLDSDHQHLLPAPRPRRLPDGPAGACLRPHIQAAGRRDGGGYRPATGRVPARARRDRLVELH